MGLLEKVAMYGTHMHYRSSWQASMGSSVVFLQLPSALMPGQTHSVAPTTVPELYSILKWNLTKGHKDMHLSNEDTVCSPNHRVLSTNPYLKTCPMAAHYRFYCMHQRCH